MSERDNCPNCGIRHFKRLPAVSKAPKELRSAVDVLADVIAAAKLGKKYAGLGTIQHREFNRIIRVATQLRKGHA